MAERVGAGFGSSGSVVTPQELESTLRERLVGRRVVAEIGLDATTFEGLSTAMAQVVGTLREPGLVGERYPALLVCYLVGHGIYGYDHGGLWSTVTVRHLDASFGPAFAKALRRFGLETFEDMVAGDNALRYVSPILAHGGIPKYSLDDLFRLVVKDAGKATDAQDLIALWRTRKTAFFQADKPVRRFLLYGGPFAVDFLDRCLDLLMIHARTGSFPKPWDVGLPAHVVVGFRRFVERVRPELRQPERRWPRPEVRLDPWGSTGPELFLPAVELEGRAFWHVQADSHLERLEAPRLDTRSVQLRPSRSWTVALTEASQTLRETTFEGIDPGEIPALFFEPSSGRLLQAGSGLRADSIWTLVPPRARVEGVTASGVEPLPVLEELPEPTGAWSGYQLRHVDVSGVRAVSVSMGPGARERRLSVRPPGGRPTLVGSLLPGVRTSAGLPVYAVLPRLNVPGEDDTEWTVRLTAGDTSTTVPAAELPPMPDGRALGSLTHQDRAGTLDLLVRGTSFGSDLRVGLAHIPGLSVRRPERLLLPGDREAVVEVSADIPLEPNGSRTLRLAAGPDDHELRFDLPSGRGPITVVITLPRLLWGAARADQGGIHLTGQKIVLAGDDLTDGLVTGLVVRTGLSGLPLRLRLVAGGDVFQDSGAGITASGEDGRWVFDLARFRDTVRTLDHPVATLELEAGRWPVRVADVRPSLHVRNLWAESSMTADVASVRVTWDEDRLLRSRVVRLWSLDRPWEGATTEPVPDDATGDVILSGYDRFAAGSYLAEVSIDDGWTTAHRPGRKAPGVVAVRVGDILAARQRLERLTIDEPLHVLEIALATGEIVRHLEPAELMKLAPAAMKALEAMLGEDPGGCLTSPRFRAVASLFTADSNTLADACAGAVEVGECTEADLLVLAVVLARRLHAGAEGVDDARLRALWEIAPALAAGLDVVPDPDTAQLARVHEFVWDPGEEEAELPLGEPLHQGWIGMPVEQLRSIRQEVELVPQQVLSLDSLVVANFEWLEAAKASGSEVEHWWDLHHSLMRELGALPAAAETHLDARKPRGGTVEWAAFPRATLACALHVIADSRRATEASRALLEAVPFAPRLVARDVVLARVVLRGWYRP